MRIASVAVSYPARIVSNEEILAGIRAQSAPYLGEEALDRLTRTVARFFRMSGARERRWRAPGRWPRPARGFQL